MSTSTNPAADVRPAWKARLQDGLDRVQQAVGQWDTLDLVGTFTVILVLVFNSGPQSFQVPIRVLCIGALVYRPLLRHPAFWLALAGVLGIMYGLRWYVADNHKFLLTYWCLALGLSTLTRDPEQALRTNARLLLGLCFLLAVLWKLRTPGFLEGGFMHFTFLTDVRFKNVAELVGGLEAGSLAYNRTEALATLTNFNSTVQEVSLQSNTRLALMSEALAWWTVVIETLIFVAFLAPTRWFISRWRDLTLLPFLLTTYAVAHVISFAWILAILGLAQASHSFKYARLLYIFALFMILVFGYEWSRVVRLVLGM